MRHPLVGILLLIGLCSAISGKPLAAGLMATLAVLLASDALAMGTGPQTISALSDPVLASHPGRTLLLAGWLLLG
jgi:hypothetical protein